MMNKAVTWKKDLYRYYSDGKVPRILPPEVKWIIFFRKAQNCKNPVLLLLYKWRLHQMQKVLHISIPINTEIDEGIYIGHTGRIVISSLVVIGKNFNIAAGGTIGKENRGPREGAPTIGNKVWIGTNAVVVGKITIGNDVLIAPNAYVNFDVPDHSIVIGNPAKIIPCENATKEYIINCV